MLLISRQIDGIINELPILSGVLKNSTQVLHNPAVCVADETQRQAALTGERAEIANRSRQTYKTDLPPAQSCAYRLVEIGIVDVPLNGR